MGVQQSLSLAKQHPPRHPTPDILPLKSSTNCAATNIPSLVPSSKLWQVVQITKNIPSLQYRFSSVTLREEILPIIFNQSHEDIYKFNDPNAMNPQQVRANDSRSWIPRLGNLGQRVGTVVSSEGPRCRTPSTRQFVDSFVLHYRGEYRKRKRGRGREGGRQNAGEIGERRYIYIYTDPREQISGRASQLGIGSGFGLTGALFVLLLLLLGPPLPAQLFGVSRVTDHARVGSSSGKLAPSVEIKGRLRFEAC